MLIIKMIMMMTMMTYYHVVQGTPCSSGPAAKVARDRSAASTSVIGIVMFAIITILITMVTISSPWDTRS